MATNTQYWRNRAAAYAAKYHIPKQIFLSQISAESGFNPNAHSGAGAQGIAQIMPFHHVGTNPERQLDWAARTDAQNLARYGDWPDALSVYNSGRPWARGKHISETSNYVNKILHSGSSYAGAGGGGNTNMASPMAHGALNIVKYLQASNAALLNHTQQPSIVGFLNSSQASPQEATGGSVAGSYSGAKGKVLFAAGADRTGVKTRPGVVQFASQVAGVYGRPVTVGTGTNHNEYVVGTHRVSDHWAGNAVDIPASGNRLTMLGQSALIAAGMSPALARRQRGGLFNVNGHQIIFNSNEGGNHYNHLHISAKG